MAEGMNRYDSECFVITALGGRDSSERRRADAVLRAVVEPVCADHDLQAVRADRIVEGGHLTLQVLQHCCGARVAIADLTGQNLNVFYEVGLRHALRRPVILIADDAEAGRLPFDLLQQRTIFFGDTLEGAADCRRTASEQIRAALAGHVDSPVGAAMSVGLLEQGTDVERTLAELVKRVESLGEVVAVAAHPGTAVPQQLNLDVLGGFTAVLEEVNAIGDDELRERLKETVANAFYPMLQFIWGRYRPHDERDESGATNADAEGQPTNPPESSTGSERLG